jgi:uncharacterized membrane protein YfcA
MTTFETICLAAVFFCTAVISVVTGSTSLITVPVMLQFGFEPHAAVATNMFALVFLSVGGTLPFLKGNTLPRKRLSALIGLTMAGSVLGAFLLLIMPSESMPLLISGAMIFVAVFLIAQRNRGLLAPSEPPSRRMEVSGYAITFALGIYGGFFSGGYVALLTAAFVGFFGMTFLEAVAVTKVLNIFSSMVATAIFAREGIINWDAGFVLGAASFVGGVVGAVVAQRMSNVWLRRIFLTVVVALAIKTLLLDVSWVSHGSGNDHQSAD